MWQALALIAASALLKNQANEDAADRRRAIQRSMESYQRTKARDVENATESLLKKQTPEARGHEMQAITADRADSLRDTVGAAQAFDAPGIAGKLSSDYERAQEAAADSIANRTKRAIAQLATMGAPGEAQLAHQLRFGRAAGEVDAANIASDAVGRRYSQDIANVTVDPFMTMLSDAGMAVGTGSIAGGAGGGSNLVSPNNEAWGSLDAGPGAFSAAKSQPSFLSRIRAGLGPVFGTR